MDFKAADIVIGIKTTKDSWESNELIGMVEGLAFQLFDYQYTYSDEIKGLDYMICSREELTTTEQFDALNKWLKSSNYPFYYHEHYRNNNTIYSLIPAQYFFNRSV